MIDSCYKKVLVVHFRHVGFFDIIIDFSGICKVFLLELCCWGLVLYDFFHIRLFFCRHMDFFL